MTKLQAEYYSKQITKAKISIGKLQASAVTIMLGGNSDNVRKIQRRRETSHLLRPMGSPAIRFCIYRAGPFTAQPHPRCGFQREPAFRFVRSRQKFSRAIGSSFFG